MQNYQINNIQLHKVLPLKINAIVESIPIITHAI